MVDDLIPACRDLYSALRDSTRELAALHATIAAAALLLSHRRFDGPCGCETCTAARVVLLRVLAPTGGQV